MDQHWTLDDIDWDRFDPAKVDPRIVRAVKAAAMVEFNAPDYVTYLCRVFSDRPDVQDAIRQWGDEESQHGQALARWAALADPDFDFDRSFKRFQDGYSIPKDAIESVRGSRAGELIARCVVESGTSSYYTAIRDATEEPVLRQIAANIAADELRHYKLFYDHFQSFEGELPTRLGRARVALGRVGEADDDELAYAYYAANVTPDAGIAYDRKIFSAAYESHALPLYQRQHTDRLISMIAKAIGVKPRGLLMKLVSPIVWSIWRMRLNRCRAAAGAYA